MIYVYTYRTDQDFCYPKSIGYAPAAIMSTINHGTNLSPSATHTVDALTKAMILHPIACALAFIAFVLSCGAGIVGSLLGAAVGALAWVLALVVMAIDFSIFGVSYYFCLSIQACPGLTFFSPLISCSSWPYTYLVVRAHPRLTPQPANQIPR